MFFIAILKLYLSKIIIKYLKYKYKQKDKL